MPPIRSRWLFSLASVFPVALFVLAGGSQAQLPPASAGFEPLSFVNFETPQVHPVDLTPSGDLLLVVNTSAASLMVFDVSGALPVQLDSIPVGFDPVSVRARSESEAWVVNLISDTISIVDLGLGEVVETVQTADEPADVIFAGSPERAFVTASQANLLQVFDPANLAAAPTDITILGEDPRALAKSVDGQTVYVAVYESGNGTTLMPGGKNIDDRIRDAAGATEGPWGGISPPPNDGLLFDPPQNPANPSPPPVGVIVRKNDSGQWTDDNGADWSELVGGVHSDLSDRIAGWDLPDRDVAVVDANTLSVDYQTRMMNMVMAIDVNPATGHVFAVGTEATNEIRFEPKLQGNFVRVHMASFDPLAPSAAATVTDLNPHLDYSTARIIQSERERAVGDPRAIAWNALGTLAYVAGMGSNNVIVVDPTGQRIGRMEVGEGPTGIVLDDLRGRGYVLNRFDASVSLVDLAGLSELSRTAFFDPTPAAVEQGRVHLYGTHEGSGLGQIACASCHVDSRSDRLSWDLGNPAGDMESRNGFDFHPMKGPLKTQSLQDIIGAPALHHRGDRDDLFGFAGAFEGLQGDDAPLDNASMVDFEAFLDTIHFPPNPNRNIDNTLSTAVPIPGPNGVPRGFGDAVAGLQSYLTGNGTSSTCANCHLGPRSRGDVRGPGGFIVGQPLVPETFSGFYDRIGLFWNSTDGSSAGFGFRPDGAQSSEFQHRTRNFPLQTESGTHIFAFQLSIEGPLPEISGFGRDAHAGVGQQVTIGPAATPADAARLGTLIAIAEVGDVDLWVHGSLGGVQRGFMYIGGDVFQSDRLDDRFGRADLDAAAATGDVLTYTLVPRGVGYRLGLDRELDGALDRDELDDGHSTEAGADLWELCALQGGSCPLAERAVLRYGSEEGFVYGVFDSEVGCNMGLFGDPSQVTPARCEALNGTLVCEEASSAIGSILPSNYQLGTLAVGEDVYVDRSYTYTGMPPELDGLPVVQTANDDKQADIELRIQLSEPRTLYVGFDDRHPEIPTWLESWDLVPGWFITSTDSTDLRVYETDFPAGEVILGGTGFTGGSSSMYIVVIEETPGGGPCDPMPLPEPSRLLVVGCGMLLLLVLEGRRKRREATALPLA